MIGPLPQSNRQPPQALLTLSGSLLSNTTSLSNLGRSLARLVSFRPDTPISKEGNEIVAPVAAEVPPICDRQHSIAHSQAALPAPAGGRPFSFTRCDLLLSLFALI